MVCSSRCVRIARNTGSELTKRIPPALNGVLFKTLKFNYLPFELPTVIIFLTAHLHMIQTVL